MRIEKQNQICPACKSNQSKEVENFTFKQEGQGFFSEQFSMLICRECNIWFKDVIPTKQILNAYYESLPSGGSDWDYQGRLPHEKKVDTILDSLKEGASVLDVGCWTGRLLFPHVKLKRFGIEPNEDSAQIASEKGIGILGPEVTNEVLGGRLFSVITLIDVFEHLYNPVEVIETLLDHLEPGGQLVIVTGASDSLPAKIASITYWYFSKIPDHIIFLNSKFVKWLSNKFPRYQITYKRIPHFNTSIKGFFKELMWLIIWRYFNPNSPFKKIVTLSTFKNLQEVIICKNLRDHMLLTIKKDY